MIHYPHYPSRRCHDLAGAWSFAFLGEADIERIDAAAVRCGERAAVPGVFDADPAWAGRRGVAVYRTAVDTTPGSAAVIRFGGCGFNVRVYVDGRIVGGCDLPYTGFAVEVPAAADGRRDLLVAVDNRFDRRRQALIEPFYDFYGYGGIYRDVLWCECGPGPRIDRARVEILDAAAGRVRVRAVLGGAAPERIDLHASFDGGPPRLHAGIAVVDGIAVIDAEVPAPRLWSPEDPALHTVEIAIPGDRVRERFGLRSVACRDGRIELNGRPVKLLGYCRHESHAQYGPALPYAQLVQDLHLLRDLGCNFIRGSHYPQDQRFLDLCDEMGFLVWEETLGWGYDAGQWEAPGFVPAQVAQSRAMVANSCNHPSVIMWGVLNEGHSHYKSTRHIYEAALGAIRALDRSRPLTYATHQFFCGNEDIHLDLVDVVACNMYPGWYAKDQTEPRPLHEIEPAIRHHRERIAAAGHGGKPFIISEIGAAALYGWRDPMHAHYSEEYQAELLDRVCQLVVGDQTIAGLAIWQFCDGRTYASSRALGRPRTFNNKGSFDEYRRPKQAAQSVRAVFRRHGGGG